VVDALAVPEPSEEELAAAEAGRLAALEATRPQNSFAMDAATYRASTETIVSPSGFGVIMHHARGVAMFEGNLCRTCEEDTACIVSLRSEHMELFHPLLHKPRP
jgi:hypothetical protein